MPRSLRVDWAGATHHVMNRGVDRGQIFFGDEDRIEFGRRLAECHERFGLELVAYCLMSNHYHLVVRTTDGELSAAMHHLATTYVRHTNDRVGRDGPLFRGRFTSIPVTTDSYLRQLVRYVHRNALDLPGVRQPEDHRWSSYRAYLGLRRPPEFLDLDLVLSLFGNDRERLAAFTASPQVPSMIVPATADELVNVVNMALATEGHASRGPRVRVVLSALLGRVERPDLQRMIEDVLAFPSATARRAARSRSTQRLRDDAAVAAVVEQLQRGWARSRPAA